MELNYPILRGGLDVAKYLGQLLQAHEAVALCEQLLADVEGEIIPPSIVTTFLTTAKSSECVKLCLLQPYSASIRVHAIDLYGKMFSDMQYWSEIWQLMGSLKGVLQYLSTVSVEEHKMFLAALAKSRNTHPGTSRRPKEGRLSLLCHIIFARL